METDVTQRLDLMVWQNVRWELVRQMLQISGLRNNRILVQGSV